MVPFYLYPGPSIVARLFIVNGTNGRSEPSTAMIFCNVLADLFCSTHALVK